MTYREFYTAISENENMSNDLRTFATNAMAKMDERNAKRAAKPSKTAAANEPIKDAIFKMMTSTPQTATEVGEKMDITTQKASALLLQMFKDGKVAQVEVKVPKKGKQKGYTLPNA